MTQILETSTKTAEMLSDERLLWVFGIREKLNQTQTTQLRELYPYVQEGTPQNKEMIQYLLSRVSDGALIEGKAGLVHQASQAVIKRIRTGEITGSIKPTLFRVLHNLTVKNAIPSGEPFLSSDALTATEEPSNLNHSPEVQYLSHFDKVKLLKALQAISAANRLSIALDMYEPSLSVEEIGIVVASLIPTAMDNQGSSKSRLKRAKNNLATKLSEVHVYPKDLEEYDFKQLDILDYVLRDFDVRKFQALLLEKHQTGRITRPETMPAEIDEPEGLEFETDASAVVQLEPDLTTDESLIEDPEVEKTPEQMLKELTNFYEENRDYLLNFVKARMGQDLLSGTNYEDIVQDTFERLVKGIAEGRYRFREVKPYVFTALRGQITTFYRHRAVWRKWLIPSIHELPPYQVATDKAALQNMDKESEWRKGLVHTQWEEMLESDYIPPVDAPKPKRMDAETQPAYFDEVKLTPGPRFPRKTVLPTQLEMLPVARFTKNTNSIESTSEEAPPPELQEPTHIQGSFDELPPPLQPELIPDEDAASLFRSSPQSPSAETAAPPEEISPLQRSFDDLPAQPELIPDEDDANLFKSSPQFESAEPLTPPSEQPSPLQGSFDDLPAQSSNLRDSFGEVPTVVGEIIDQMEFERSFLPDGAFSAEGPLDDTARKEIIGIALALAAVTEEEKQEKDNWIDTVKLPKGVKRSLLKYDNSTVPTDDTETAELLELALQRDNEALGKLYVRNSARIYTYIYRRVGNEAIANDIASEVFFKMLNAIPRGNAWHTSFSGWLYRIAHNAVIDYYRQRDRQQQVQLDDALEISATDHNPVAIAEANLDANRLRAAIARLTEEQADVIGLRFLEGFSISEVATMMDKTEGSVKALQYRAVATLRQLLQNENLS
jgi:RNA polymerase sigma-70 factor (ECF subfamily)